MKLTEEQIREITLRNRAIRMKPGLEEYEDYHTDQELKKPQPPLVKAPMREESIALPLDFSDLNIDNDFLHIINSRESHRVYTEEKMNILQLSYLLWCTQGVKEIRGKSYATLRTVPCGGARHPFETYMAVQNVDGLVDGYYHYLPMKHQIELLKEADDIRAFITESLQGQKWAEKANVVFYYGYVCYRAEWRYGIFAHRMNMADVGHILENLYLSVTSIGLGGCAIGAVDGPVCDEKFELDGEEEFTVIAMPVGTISAKDKKAEKDFYRFVEEEGL